MFVCNHRDPATYPKPEFYQTPSSDNQWSFWQFSLINFSFFTLPHCVQRVYAARDLHSLKVGYTIISMGPWIASFVGIFMGTVGVTMLVNEDGTPRESNNPFTDILEKVMSLGGFAKGAGVIAITASLAAIMSTADSLIIAISQLVTAEIIYPSKPNATPQRMAWYGRITSLISVFVSLIIGIFWDEGISDLTNIQFPITAQAVPAFLFGLYTRNQAMDVHPWCIAFGAWTAVIFVFSTYYMYLKPVPDSIPMDAGVVGFCLQLSTTLLLESFRRLVGGRNRNEDAKEDKTHSTQLLFPDRPSWDVPKMQRFGEHTLSPQLIWKSMEGVYEPMTSLSWTSMMILTISFATPMVAQLEPPFDASAESGNVFLYPPAIFNGLPWWVFKTILISSVPFFMLFVAIYKSPSEYPDTAEIIAEKKKLIELDAFNDPDLVELTPAEMGRRMSYDEPNVLVQRRRSTIFDTHNDKSVVHTMLSTVEMEHPTMTAPPSRSTTERSNFCSSGDENSS